MASMTEPSERDIRYGLALPISGKSAMSSRSVGTYCTHAHTVCVCVCVCVCGREGGGGGEEAGYKFVHGWEEYKKVK